MNIKCISLLSEAEFDKAKNYIPECDCQMWWLRSPYYLPHRACAVYINSYVGNSPVSSSVVGVRPVLCFDNEGYSLSQKIDVFGYTWTVVLIEDNTVLALCDDVVGRHCFDSDTNDFETSEIKSFLENWFMETQEKPVNFKYNYRIAVGLDGVIGSVVVPADAGDNDVRLAILDSLGEVSYERVFD